jgi:hypothetical protein
VKARVRRSQEQVIPRTVRGGLQPATRPVRHLRADTAPPLTVAAVETPGIAVSAELLRKPFIASWFHRARQADQRDPDPARRAAAWAQWALTSMSPMTGNSDRPYTALTLPGKFYDPRGTGPTVRPHLEIPAGLFDRAAPEFPDRLAQLGNGLLFPWWIIPEVMAVKRALFSTGRGSIADLVELLNSRRPALVDALTPMTGAAGRRWTLVEGDLLNSPAELGPVATAPFTEAEVADYLPPAAELKLTVEFDAKLRESSNGGASRRVGVWRISGEAGEPFTLGVITPRLTRGSLFNDPLFAADREAPAALLVRGLLLRRLLRTALGGGVGVPVAEPAAAVRAQAGPRLRAIVARVGDKLPEAGVASAVHFLQTYPEPEDAWRVLSDWGASSPAGGEGRRAVLTVSEDGFKAAHRAALRALRRAEEPQRDDINVVLPLAWDSRSRVVRVTFSRPAPDEPAE